MSEVERVARAILTALRANCPTARVDDLECLKTDGACCIDGYFNPLVIAGAVLAAARVDRMELALRQITELPGRDERYLRPTLFDAVMIAGTALEPSSGET